MRIYTDTRSAVLNIMLWFKYRLWEKVLPGAKGCVQSSLLSVALVLGLQTVRWKQHQQQVWRLATVTALFKHLQIPSVHKAVIYTCEPEIRQKFNKLYRAFLLRMVWGRSWVPFPGNAWTRTLHTLKKNQRTESFI